MRYLVVLDPRSAIGAQYAVGSNDGFVAAGDERCPTLDCLEAATDAPYYLFVKRDMKRAGHKGQTQTLFIPHGAVAYIVAYDVGDPLPMGFHATGRDVQQADHGNNR